MANLPYKPSKLMMKGFIDIEGRQAKDELIISEDGWNYAACALGCIYIGLGISPEALYEESVDTEKLNQQLFDGWKAYHPVSGYLWPVVTILTDLNDTYDWPVWKISNWLSESLGL